MGKKQNKKTELENSTKIHNLSKILIKNYIGYCIVAIKMPDHKYEYIANLYYYKAIITKIQVE